MKQRLMKQRTTQVEWKDPEHMPVTPRLIGTKVFDGYPLQDVVDFIDWNPFFSVCPQFSAASLHHCAPALECALCHPASVTHQIAAFGCETAMCKLASVLRAGLIQHVPAGVAAARPLPQSRLSQVRPDLLHAPLGFSLAGFCLHCCCFDEAPEACAVCLTGKFEGCRPLYTDCWPCMQDLQR